MHSWGPLPRGEVRCEVGYSNISADEASLRSSCRLALIVLPSRDTRGARCVSARVGMLWSGMLSMGHVMCCPGSRVFFIGENSEGGPGVLYMDAHKP